MNLNSYNREVNNTTDVKAIFFDIDGTLVSFATHVVPPDNVSVIEELRRCGIKVFICTGRMVKMTQVLDSIEYDGIIANNGATCYIPVEGISDKGEVYINVGRKLLKLLSGRPLPKEQLSAVAERLSDASYPPVAVSFMTDEDYYINARSPIAEEVARQVGVKEPTLLPVDEIIKMPVYQLCVYLSGRDLSDFMTSLPRCEASSWSPLFADVNERGVDKAYGIDKICKEFDIPLSSTMSFGDGGNDLPMLRHTPLSVAMGNAPAFVKEACNYVTGRVDERGIREALNHFGII